jgi:hypothetical protein
MFLEDHALHKTLAERALQAPLPPNLQYWQSWLTYIHWQYMLETYIIKIGLYRTPILAGFGWICSGVLWLCANIALVWWVQDFVEFRKSCNLILTLRENQYEFQTLKCNILVWCTMWICISMILMRFFKCFINY